MALYEYLCEHCGRRFEKRMPMSEVLQLVPCPKCHKQARKTIGSFAVIGRADESFGDGPAPWDSGGDNGHGHDHGHDHGHGSGGDSHSHGFDDVDF